MNGNAIYSNVASENPGVEPFRYAVIDLAVAEGLRPVIVRLLPSVAEPLFARTFARELLEVGPWLVRLSKTPQVERALAEMAPDMPSGYYAHSMVDIISLRQ